MIGREHEIKELNRLYNSDKAQLVAVYGRRRVGKTYLIDETFKGRINFRHAGLSPVDADSSGSGMLKEQLKNFSNSLLLHGASIEKKPTNWLDAFLLLEKYLQETDNGTRQLVFLDELPWMDSPRSGFLTAFESFWNNWGCHRKNLMVVVCGSANSWILDKLINSHGGLYNRVTYEIKLEPFKLCECKEFYKYSNIKMSDYDIAQSYMVLGGIPYYMGYLEPEFSFAQNVDKLFFAKNAKLKDEFNRLFNSVFSNPEAIKKIVKALATNKIGLSRSEISKKTKIANGGTLSQQLNALIASDFVTCYVPFGTSKREEKYKLIDPFCIFYLKFVAKYENGTNEHFWQENCTAQSIVSWRGFAFENLCFNHIDQIKMALGISGISSTQYAWHKKGDAEPGTQIDLLIDRKDNVIDMCEIKFYSEDFTIKKDYYLTLANRQNILSESIPKKKIIHSILITSYGLKNNEYSGAISSVITLKDLFKEI